MALIAGRAVVCSGAEHDRYGRLLARCRAGEDDLNRRQVSGGWALAYGGYDDAEAEARAARRGLWAGTFDSPRHWRDTHAGPPAEAAPAAQATAAGWLDLVAGWLSELLGFRSPASSGTGGRQGGSAVKLFDGGRAPNPRRVRIFLAEKGSRCRWCRSTWARWGTSGEAVSSRNPLQRLPVLELDDGTILTESIAICRYFEELHPEPALFGRGALGKARVEMWQRRMEFNLLSCVAHAFRHIHPAMKEWEIPQVPEWGEANKPKAIEFLACSTASLPAGTSSPARLFDRRHHRPDRHRFHEAGAHQGPGRVRQCAALARGDLQPAECSRLTIGRRCRTGSSRPREVRACRICATTPSAGRCRMSRGRCCVPRRAPAC